MKLTPAVKDYIWGGTRLRESYNIKSDLARLAEAWVLSCHKDGESSVANGVFAGKTLSEVLKDKTLLGKNALKFENFPVLIKLIDAKDNLSVQVHPSDDYALKNEGEYGKTEMWYVVDCEPGACLYYGFKKEISADEFKERIHNNTLLEVLNKVPVSRGDCFFIESGTIHAIGAGILIAEVQQNSNTTYRVYDYGRVGADGNPRELHIEKAVAVTNLCPPAAPVLNLKKSGNLSSCKYFTTDLLCLDGKDKINADEKSFVSVLAVSGEGEICGEHFSAGDSFFLPAGFGETEIFGNANLILTRV
jgi:mannose-6-phosphate isomerase